jgi:hypothetical protein
MLEDTDVENPRIGHIAPEDRESAEFRGDETEILPLPGEDEDEDEEEERSWVRELRRKEPDRILPAKEPIPASKNRTPSTSIDSRSMFAALEKIWFSCCDRDSSPVGTE